MYQQAADIEAYSILHSSAPSSLLQKIERETYLRTLQPNMISGCIQGQFLAWFISAMDAKKVLEIGTFTGYTTVSIAEKLQSAASITTIEINPESHWLANQFFEEFSEPQKINSILGNAMDHIESMDETWDFILIDAAKKDNDYYYEKLLPKLRSGGIIAVDNVLWKGKILENLDDKRTQLIDRFNKKVASDDRVESLMIPLRDGLTLLRKR